MRKGFFAYSSEHPHSGEAIEDAIKKINDSENASITSWRKLKISGRLIITKILDTIDYADFVCVDLTGMNENVLFELGYAIAKHKPIFLIHDDSIIDSEKRFKELDFLTTVGYTHYRNTDDIVRNFYEEEIHTKTDDIYSSMLRGINDYNMEKPLFYLKSQIDTNYSQIIINQLDHYSLPYTMDDPLESKIQPLSWYLENLNKVPALIAEFSSTHRSGHKLQNMKCSFISGLALALDKRLLMVAEMPYPTPLDYKELLVKFNNKSTCQEAIEPFVNSLKNDIAKLFSTKRKLKEKRKKISKLQNVKFGEFIAEHETSNLYDYYIETIHYQNILKSEHNIVIGRKGTGKTAALYYIKDIISEDRKNHVCVIKPVNFEIEGLIVLMKSLKNDFERGYLIESIWKFLIYSEVAKSLYTRIQSKRAHEITVEDNDFIKYVEENNDIILTDFSSRLEKKILDLKSLEYDKQSEFKIKISEVLHTGIINKLRNLIISVTNDVKEIVVLIDNIDKSWKKNQNLNFLSRYILGLLGVVGRIIEDFEKSSPDQIKFTFHLTLFLRSDIFKYIMDNAREPDKIEYTKLLWNDPEIFFRIIEERLEVLSNDEIDKETFWKDYITNEVKGEEVKDFVLNRVIPRPRDIIYFFNSSKNIAVSRGHDIIEASDLEKAYKDYSSWVFKSILVENGVTIKEMEDFLFELVGESAILTKEDIERYMIKSGVNVEKHTVNYFISHLQYLTFIGPEISKDNFMYNYDYDYAVKLKKLSEKYGSDRYRINNAFIPFLECEV